MQLERKELEGKRPLLVVSSPVTIDESLVDPYGNHLNHAMALRLFELERVRILESHGIPYDQLAERFGILFFVHQLEAIYPRQAFLGDTLDVVSSVYPKSASLIFHNKLQKQGQDVIEAFITLAAVDIKTSRPARIPKSLLELF